MESRRWILKAERTSTNPGSKPEIAGRLLTLLSRIRLRSTVSTKELKVTICQTMEKLGRTAGQAVQALMRSGLEAGNRYTTTVKPTEFAWSCHVTDCSTRVQVPYPYCTYDCVGDSYCDANSTDPSGMPVDRFVSYCDYHPWWADQNGNEPSQSLFNCRNLNFHDDVYLPAVHDLSMGENWTGGWMDESTFTTYDSAYGSAWKFEMVTEMLCLPLEEIYSEDVVWLPNFRLDYDIPMKDTVQAAKDALPTTTECPYTGSDRIRSECRAEENPMNFYWAYYEWSVYSLYFQSYSNSKGTQMNGASSFNPNIANRDKFHDPVMEQHASKWSAFAETPSAHESFSGRKFLPDTIKRIS
eukprot:gene5158-34973_t